MHPHLSSTPLLDYNHPKLQELVDSRGWSTLSPSERVGAAYDFVRDEIRFGYNAKDDLPASQILAEGIGQCNTKATLLMALLRALELPCRLHGFTIDKALQRGVVPELVYPITPDGILHSWVEVLVLGRWVRLEGFILDREFLSQLQRAFAGETEVLCGYGVGTERLSAPGVRWQGQDTFIQSTAIALDFGLFDSPDAFYAVHQQDLSALKRLIYQYGIRHWMNARVAGMRAGGPLPEIPGLSEQWAP